MTIEVIEQPLYIEVVEELGQILEVVLPGPQGAKGDPGDPGPAGPPGGVDTVNGMSGDVLLDAAGVGAQSADADLTAIAGLDSATAGTIGTDGAGWVKKTWAQVKAALGLTKADVGLGNVDNTSDVNKPVSAAQQAALNAKADLVGGVIPTAQLPAIATGQTVTVANQAAMLALTAAQVQPGDVAIRSDQAGRRWLLAAANPAVLGNWIQLETPDAVTSVNGQAGAVVLAKGDVGLGNVDNTSDATKPVSAAQQAALDAKQPLAAPLTSIAGLALAGNAGKVLTVNPAASGYELDTPAAGGGGAPTAFHGVRLYNTADVSIANGGQTVTWNAETYDTDAYHDLVTNPTRVTIPAGLGGKYSLKGLVEFAFNATGNRSVAIYKNGVVVAWGTELAGANAGNFTVAVSVDTTLDLVAGDYVELFAFHNSGAALNALHIGAGADTRFEVVLSGITVATPLTLSAGIASDVVLVLKGATGQTANLEEFRDSANTLLTSVQANGAIYATNESAWGGAAWWGGGINVQPPAAASNVGIVVRGRVSQTGDLMAVQDSAGTKKGGFDSAGHLIISDRSTAARAGGAAPALPAAPVGYAGVRGENGTLYYFPYYT